MSLALRLPWVGIISLLPGFPLQPPHLSPISFLFYLLSIKKKKSTVLYSTGNYTQYFVTYKGEESGKKKRYICMHQFSSVAQSCPTLRDPMNRSTPGLPVHHHLLDFTQTHVHRVGDAIQPSHPLSSPSPPAPNPSQHQSLFQ